MAKRVLVVYYSQTGQLETIMHSIVHPLEQDDGVEVTYLPLQSSENFSFPWTFWTFFDLFPESVYAQPPLNEPFEIADMERFDLIVLGYQPWFLSPSMPITAFMQSSQAKIILANKPVVSVIGCRNMWIQAHEDMKKWVENCGGRIIDNIVLSDQSGPLESFITTPRWMLTGKRESFWGLSSAGISDADILACRRFGVTLANGMYQDKEKRYEAMCQGLGAVCADSRFFASEKIGKRSFRIWGTLVRVFGRRGSWSRRPILGIYVVFLVTLIITVVPLNMALGAVVRRVFKGKMDKIVREIEAPSGR